MLSMADTATLRGLAGDSEEKLVSLLFAISKNARIVDRNNPVLRRQCRNFYALLRDLLADREHVSVKMIDGRFFVDQKLARFDAQSASGSAAVIKGWISVGLGGVIFKAGLTMEHLEEWFVFLGSVWPRGEDAAEFSELLRGWSIPSVQMLSAQELESERPAVAEELRRQFRASARGTFFRAMTVVEDNMVCMAEGREVDVSTTKRIVRSLIEHITKDDQSLLELAAIKDFDDYTYAHSTNVCVYALTLGVRLGLDRGRLSQLGFAGLFHDVGKIKLSADLIRKPDAYDENDWIQMQRHPLLGAKTMLRNLKLDVHTARAARAALEHHINDDLTGYPVLHGRERPQNLFSRIISIVDTFDALTSGRVYLRNRIAPDKVLKKMHYQMRVKFDAFLLKIFTNVIGVFPAGTLVLLSSDELALVLTNNDSDKARPYVKIVGNRQGLLPSPEWVDLSLPEHAHRTIVRMVDPTRYGLDIKDFIFSD